MASVTPKPCPGMGWSQLLEARTVPRTFLTIPLGHILFYPSGSWHGEGEGREGKPGVQRIPLPWDLIPRAGHLIQGAVNSGQLPVWTPPLLARGRREGCGLTWPAGTLNYGRFMPDNGKKKLSGDRDRLRQPPRGEVGCQHWRF